MPTYDYKCTSCKDTFEAYQSITAKPLKKCPACGKKTLKRLIGAGAGILFKGSGFYETDYRSESYRNQEKKEKETLQGSKETKQSTSPASKSDKKKRSRDKIKAAS